VKPTLISKNRLKIQLSADDLIQMNLTYELLDYNETTVREVLWELIGNASRQTGFESQKGKIMIEAVPAKSGGCTLYITKLPGNVKTGHARTTKSICAEPYIFRFDHIDDIMNAAKCFKTYEDVILGHSAIYKSEGDWFLVFSPIIPGLNSAHLDNLLGMLGEWGQEDAGGDWKEAYLAEHGNLIALDQAAENFIRKLG
jgi:negative regulator of genetic competence, sporulation and motility